jgi:type I restriction enzyme S subunit
MEKLVPKLRFPEFKKNWENKSFNSLYTFKSTNSFSRENLNYENGEIKNIHYGDIHTKFNTLFDITIEKVPFINPTIDIAKIKEDSYVEEGDLIIADASENYDDIGKMIEVVNVNNEKLVAGLHTFLAKRKNSNNAIGFTANLVKTWNVRQQILKIAQGTKVLSLSTGRLGEITLTIPQPEEQQKIATFLTSVDERLTLLAQQKEKLELYKKGVMQQIFSQKLRFKDEKGNNYPDWKRGRFSKFIKLYRGSSPRPIVRYITTNKDGVNWIKIGDTKNSNNYRISSVSEKITKEGSLKSRAVKSGEIILANSMSFGKSYLLQIDGCIYDGWFVLREYEKHYEKEFLLQILNSEFLQKQYFKLSTGGVVQNISSEIVYSTDLFCPCLEEQQKIASFLSAIDVQIEGVSKKIEQTKMFKKGLLQQMFV